jgi:hypothetical protein
MKLTIGNTYYLHRDDKKFLVKYRGTSYTVDGSHSFDCLEYYETKNGDKIYSFLYHDVDELKLELVDNVVKNLDDLYV